MYKLQDDDTSKKTDASPSGLPKDVELINGNVFTNFNNVLEKSTVGSVMYKTLEVDPLVSIWNNH